MFEAVLIAMLLPTLLSLVILSVTLADFKVGVDETRLDHTVFAGLPAGSLPPDAHRIGRVAANTNVDGSAARKAA